MVPCVLLVWVQVKAAPIVLVGDWPVPTPDVVQAAARMETSVAAAILSESTRILRPYRAKTEHGHGRTTKRYAGIAVTGQTIRGSAHLPHGYGRRTMRFCSAIEEITETGSELTRLLTLV